MPARRRNLFVQGKPQRLDEMQARAGGHAESRDISRVRRNFRFNQNDMKHRRDIIPSPRNENDGSDAKVARSVFSYRNDLPATTKRARSVRTSRLAARIFSSSADLSDKQRNGVRRNIG